jgi:hypothetical protein
MAASSSGERRDMDAPALGPDRTGWLPNKTHVEDLIEQLTSLGCALETLHVRAGFQPDKELRERFTIAVGRSNRLKSFYYTDYGYSMIDWDKLCELLKSNQVLESLDIKAGTLPTLDIQAGTMPTSHSLRDMLRENTKLSNLRLRDVSWTLSEVKELSGVLSRDAATGLQANETLQTLELCVQGSEQAEVVANMLRTNRTIRQLAIRGLWSESKGVVSLLEAVEGNSVLRLLDFSHFYVPEKQEVFDAILNRLQTNPWLHMNLRGTELSRSPRFSIIEQKLEQNALLFKSRNPSLVKSNGARLFLCGSPGAGKCSSHPIQVLYVMFKFEFFTYNLHKL